MLVYKVLDAGPRGEKRLRSSNGFNPASKMSVLYRVGEFIEPRIKGTPLMAFETLEQAAEYCTPWCDVVYRAEAEAYGEPATRLLQIVSPPNRVRAFWSRTPEGRRRFRTSDVPEGTVLCKRIRLIEKVVDRRDWYAYGRVP